LTYCADIHFMIGGTSDSAVRHAVRLRILRTEPIIAPASIGAPIAEMLLRDRFSFQGFLWSMILLVWALVTLASIRIDQQRSDERTPLSGTSIILHGALLGSSPLVLGLDRHDLVARAIGLAVFAFVTVVSALALSGERRWNAGRTLLLFGPLTVWSVTNADWKFLITVSLVFYAAMVTHESATRVTHSAIRTTLANEFLLRELEIANRRLSHDTTHDGLTGLGNRQLFSTQLEAAFCAEDGVTVAVSFLDIDKFKSINDTYGHDVGDLVLVEVAKRIEAFCGAALTAARRSGDEFTVLHPIVDPKSSEGDVASDLHRAIAGPLQIGDVSIAVNCSVGTAFRQYDDSTSSLLRHADAALYEAKRTGRGRGVGYRTLDLSAAEALTPVEID
jgi:diguanylate cyclase (GGDEF)-like protein